MSPVLKYFNLWRHGRGFGIHSPFAFRFITEVLRLRTPYYAYRDIPDRGRLRQIFRVVCHFRAQRVAVLSDVPGPIEAAVRRVGRAVQTLKDNPDFVVADMRVATPEAIAAFIAGGARGAYLLNCNRSMLDAVTATMSRGMSFDNCRGTAVIAALPHLPRQDFKVKF